MTQLGSKIILSAVICFASSLAACLDLDWLTFDPRSTQDAGIPTCPVASSLGQAGGHAGTILALGSGRLAKARVEALPSLTLADWKLGVPIFKE